MQYIAPGLIMMSVITNSYGNVVSSFFGAKFGRHIEELLVSPLPNWLIVLGYVTGGLHARPAGRRRRHDRGAVLHASARRAPGCRDRAPCCSRSIVFSLGGFVNAVFAKNFDQISFIPTFILTPLTYLGGVFYSITMLPRMGAERLARESDPVHGQRVPVRLPRPVRRRASAFSFTIMILARRRCCSRSACGSWSAAPASATERPGLRHVRTFRFLLAA